MQSHYKATSQVVYSVLVWFIDEITGINFGRWEIWYSGKDSIYTLYNAITKGHEIVALGHLTPANDELDIDSYMYQTICSNLIPSIAKCLGFPLFIQKIMGNS